MPIQQQSLWPDTTPLQHSAVDFQERDNLKEIITSYESESTMVPDDVAVDKVLRLESQLKADADEVDRLEQELRTAPTPVISMVCFRGEDTAWGGREGAQKAI